MKRLAGFGVSLVNVHAAGGKQMMESALEGLEAGTPAGQKRPSLIAVTQLTSTSSEMLQRELLIETPLLDTVVHYSRLAEESGLDGVVCSVHEAEHIYRAVSVDFLTVTPGIRMADDKTTTRSGWRRLATQGKRRVGDRCRPFDYPGGRSCVSLQKNRT